MQVFSDATWRTTLKRGDSGDEPWIRVHPVKSGNQRRLWWYRNQRHFTQELMSISKSEENIRKRKIYCLQDSQSCYINLWKVLILAELLNTMTIIHISHKCRCRIRRSVCSVEMWGTFMPNKYDWASWLRVADDIMRDYASSVAKCSSHSTLDLYLIQGQLEVASQRWREAVIGSELQSRAAHRAWIITSLSPLCDSVHPVIAPSQADTHQEWFLTTTIRPDDCVNQF